MADAYEEVVSAVAGAAAAQLGLRGIYGSITGGGLAGWDYVGTRLRDEYIKNATHDERRAAAKKRDELYKGQGDQYLIELIKAAFTDLTNQDLRIALLDWSRWNNVIKRVVHEKASVYSEPAKRRLGAGDDKRYQTFLERVKQDVVMRELNRKLVLHEDVWVQYRVRSTPRGREPVIDVISPACFWAISHPRDATMLVGIILDQSPSDPRYVTADTPCYRVWTDAETFMLDAQCRVIQSTVEPWALGRMPGVLATTVPPSTKGCLLEQCPSADLVAAHQAIWFLNLTLLKESKSRTQQTVFTGDTSEATMGQTSDTDTDIHAPEGVSVQTVDRGVELKQFSETSTSVLDDTAANHGLPPSVMHHRDATSGAEIQLRRIPLRELRRDQIVVLRGVERELFAIQVGVNGMPDAAGDVEYADGVFPIDDWGMDFGEVQQPLTEAEKDATFEKRRQLMLTDTIEELCARNPDLTPELAQELIELHITRETDRVVKMRTLQALSGNVSTSADDPTPADNGQAGQAAGKKPGDGGAAPAAAAA